MYDYFKGIPTDKRKTTKGTFVSIEVAGIGYLLEVTERDFVCLQCSENEKNKFSEGFGRKDGAGRSSIGSYVDFLWKRIDLHRGRKR